MTNNHWCVESAGGNPNCGNRPENHDKDLPLCPKCVEICGPLSKPESEWTAYSWNDNPSIVKEPFLCSYCLPKTHYKPISALIAWHKTSANGCTCWCKVENNNMIVKTQKARGIFALQSWNNDTFSVPETSLLTKNDLAASQATAKKATSGLLGKFVNFGHISRRHVSSLTGLRDGDPKNGFPCLPPDIEGCVFIRPCPTRPRHGFVDSRCVSIPTKPTEETAKKLLDGITAIYDEAISADPEAEILFMPFIPADFNLVATPSQITIGPGNDGATSGNDTISLPLVEIEIPNSANLMQSAGIESYPYFELVGYRMAKSISSQQWPYTIFLAQLRDGPKTSGPLKTDYVPETTIVKQVIVARGSLLEWEKTIEKLGKKKKDGVVIWHPRGSLVSHYAVHCRAHKIPIVTSADEPAIGTVLECTETKTHRAKKADRESIIRGIREGLSIKGKEILPSEAVVLMLYALHNSSAMDLSDAFQARILGYSLGIAVQLSAVACIGELRHGDGPDCDHIYGHIHGGTGKNREVIYQANLAKDWPTTFGDFASRYIMFGYDGWNGSVGGVRWYECAESALELWNSVCAYVNGEKTPIAPMLADLNRVVNVCHNVAKMLTKFVTNVSAFDVASRSPVFIGAMAAPTAYKLSKLAQTEDNNIEFKSVEVKTFLSFRRALNTQRRAAQKPITAICLCCRYRNPVTNANCSSCDQPLDKQL